MDLAGDARTLVRHGATELRLRDRPPDAHEQHAVGDDPQEVPLQDEIARDDRGEHEVEVGEQGQRRREAHPVVEVSAVAAVPTAEADERNEPERGQETSRHAHVQPLGEVVLALTRWPRDVEQGRCHEQCRNPRGNSDERASTGCETTVGVRGDRYQTGAEETCADELPGGFRGQRPAVEHRYEAEGERAERDAPEPGREQQVEDPPLDEKPDAREHADERRDHGDRRIEGQPRVVQLVRRLQGFAEREQSRSGRKEADEQNLPDEPRSIALGPRTVHVSLVGIALGADKGLMGERVLIVDDHPLTRDALSALLDQQGFDVVGAADEGAKAITEAEALQPDLVLLDLAMPGMDGLTALPRIRESAPSCEVVVLTASDAEDNLLAAIRAGASGYLLKTEPPEQIASFLRSVARGDAALSGGVARRLLDRVRQGGRPSGVPEEITRVLSAREVEVLLLLDEHLGTDQIAQRLFISEHTVRSHVKSLLRKLGVSSRREALDRLETART